MYWGAGMANQAEKPIEVPGALMKAVYKVLGIDPEDLVEAFNLDGSPASDIPTDVAWACCAELGAEGKDPNHPTWKMDTNYHCVPLDGFLGAVHTWLGQRHRSFNPTNAFAVTHGSDELAILIGAIALVTT
jgi:hypothetical protein